MVAVVAVEVDRGGVEGGVEDMGEGREMMRKISMVIYE